MADVDDVEVLLRHPVERLDPAVIVEVQEVVVWHRLVFADVGALQRPVSRKQHHDHAVGMARRHAVQQHGLSAQGDRHVLVEHTVRNRGRHLLADDRLQRALIGNDQRAIVLEDLAAADVVRVSMGEDYVFYRNVKTPLDFIAQSGRSAGHSGIDDPGHPPSSPAPGRYARLGPPPWYGDKGSP